MLFIYMKMIIQFNKKIKETGGNYFMKISKIVKVLLATFLITATLVGCSSKDTATSSETSGASEPETIVVGIGNAYKPYCYLDEKGELAGYELEVLKEVNKRLPQYKFEYQPQEFKNILIGLGAKKVDIGAHQYEKNPEREEKYLFADESYTNYILRVVVKKDRTDINSIDDLRGKKAEVEPGTNNAYVLEDYNKKNNNAVNLVYSSGDRATTVKNLEDGRIDGFIAVKRVVADLNKAYGDKLKTVGDPVSTSNTYYVFRKDDKQLKADIDKAIKSMHEDGTLSKISNDILGGDYTKNE